VPTGDDPAAAGPGHVPVRPNYILRREGESEAWRESVYSFRPVNDPDRPGEYVRVSGAGSERERLHSLRLLTDHYFGGADPLVRQLREDQFDPGRRTGIVVNSYDQVAFIKAHLRRTSSSAHRVIGVTSDIRKVPSSERGEGVAASQVARATRPARPRAASRAHCSPTST
jgi:hypothetical protein